MEKKRVFYKGPERGGQVGEVGVRLATKYLANSNAEYRIAGNREYSVGVSEILLGNSDGVFTVELLAKHCEAG